jgi:NitT/TauT family transport system ATP-binding protein
LEIPAVNYSVLLGFLEVLDDLGNKSDVAGIASKQGLELDDLLPILDSGEMLGLIQVRAGDVSITEKGHLFIVASPKVRKKILRQTLIQLDVFEKLVELIRQSENGQILKSDVLEFISSRNISATDSDSSKEFDWLIEWGRESLILTYDANSESVGIRQQRNQ